MKRLALLVICLTPHTSTSQARGWHADLFAPSRISRLDSNESFSSLAPDGREFYYTIHRADFSHHRIVVSHLDKGGWSTGATLPFSGAYNDREPRLSPDGSRIYFSSNRPVSAGDTARRRDLDLWMAERARGGAWGAPQHIEIPVNSSSNDFSPVVTSNGTLYSQGLGGDDLFVTSRVGADWEPMRHVGQPVNSEKYDYGPSISPDGRWLFFTSWRAGDSNIYRVDARVLATPLVKSGKP